MRSHKSAPCPCGSLKQYEECCLPFHNGSRMPSTAEQLMRSRYSAFCLKELNYLFNSWHPAFRPAAEEILSGTRHYLSLQIIDTDKGREEDSTGTVSFIVRYIQQNRLCTMKEKSSFVKQQSRWLYEEGEAELTEELLKKNSPCPCGSGKKFKRCCQQVGR